MNLTKEMQDLRKLTEETTRLVINSFSTKYNKTNIVVQDNYIHLISQDQQLKSISEHVNSITNNMNNVKEELNTIIAHHSMLENIQNLLKDSQ